MPGFWLDTQNKQHELMDNPSRTAKKLNNKCHLAKAWESQLNSYLPIPFLPNYHGWSPQAHFPPFIKSNDGLSDRSTLVEKNHDEGGMVPIVETFILQQ
jgi:hypothetical protein